MTKEKIDEIDEMEEDTQKDKYLTFTLDNEYFGIDILFVTEIIGIHLITPVPDFPAYVKGIINLRGKIIPTMDVRLRFKKEAQVYDERTCIIVVDIGETSIGLIVDRVSEVIDIPDENISPPPHIGKHVHHGYVKAIGKIGEKIKLILDCEKLLSEDEIEKLTEVMYEM